MNPNDPRIEGLRSAMAAKMKHFDRPIFGYEKGPEIERKEGEIWYDENNKKWTVKNGIKQSISKLQEAKRPWFCPKCSKAMSNRFDDKFYNLYNQCYDCTINQHTKMMIDGTWAEFEKKTLRANEKAMLREKITEHKEYIRTFKLPQIHFEDGRWEELAQLSHFEELFDKLKEDIGFCENKLKMIESEEQQEQETMSAIAS